MIPRNVSERIELAVSDLTWEIISDLEGIDWDFDGETAGAIAGKVAKLYRELLQQEMGSEGEVK